MVLGVRWREDLPGTARSALWDAVKREAVRMRGNIDCMIVERSNAISNVYEDKIDEIDYF